MNGEWIGNRWWGATPGASPEYNRLSRKLTLLLARADRVRTASGVRRYCAYVNAAEIVGARLDALDERRLAA